MSQLGGRFTLGMAPQYDWSGAGMPPYQGYSKDQAFRQGDPYGLYTPAYPGYQQAPPEQLTPEQEESNALDEDVEFSGLPYPAASPAVQQQHQVQFRREQLQKAQERSSKAPAWRDPNVDIAKNKALLSGYGMGGKTPSLGELLMILQSQGMR